MPILKWKRGEQSALANLFPNDKSLVRPILEILSDTLEIDQPGHDPYVKVVNQIANAWGNAPAFVDLGALEPDQQAPGGVHPVEYFFTVARNAGLQLIPITGPYRDNPFQSAVATVATTDRRGAGMRATQDEVFEPTFSADLSAATNAIGLAPQDVDLVLDWQAIAENQQGSTAAAASGIITGLPSLAAWRTITFAASSFPRTLQQIGVGVGSIQRTEWLAWVRIRNNPGITRSILFGDYAAQSPEFDPSNRFLGSAAIRYTTTDSWLIVRGRALAGAAYGGFSQFVGLSRQLVADPIYCGAAFSHGDNHIAQCANGTVGTGSLTTWKTVATNHHITFVVRQLATAVALSAGPVPSHGGHPTVAVPQAVD
ncbi:MULTISPECIES: beta family protein [unclassified Corallococcus]|uniref:beta family protein n=1 Tax=unclassified Corallococcus TaxID=2685029 RepID=UPI001A9099FF|nr:MULTISPECIES: beta family protein [unclassified Corallococcus]MBN9683631.1 beta family protein [Corallococcus sp. NCSPR001]WAS84857.1 beta family protein [Corallococcus sp. NCRR]